MDVYLLGVYDKGVERYKHDACVYMIFHKPTKSVAVYDHEWALAAYRQWRNKLTPGGLARIPLLMRAVFKSRSEFRFVVVQTFAPEQGALRTKRREEIKAWYRATHPSRLLNMGAPDAARLTAAARRKVKLLPPDRRPGRGALRRALKGGE